jgi:thiol-disulfide isomerase/thioredoxin
MKRRALFVGSGLAAAAAGLGLSWWQMESARPGASDAQGSDPWALRFARPEGGELEMAQLRGRPLVLNFWATWCPPCIREMPQLNRFAREFGPAGWQVVGLAAEPAEPVRRFLKTRPIEFPIGLGGAQALDLSRELGNPQGALPFTAVFDAAGRKVRQRLGETHFEELAEWARQLSQTPAT